MRILERKAEIAAAQQQFRTAICTQASESIQVTIGFQSGNADAKVHWLATLGIWAFFGEPPLEKSPGARYWNVFGIGKPSGNVSITCEINPPKEGINRQASGAFAADSSGVISIVHRGIFNAGGRVPLDFTRQNFHWQWRPIVDGDRKATVLVIGTLGAPSFPQSLRDFVFEVKDFKELARSRPWLT